MPPNQVALSAGVIAVSVAVAAAIAVYESPELRRMAEELRRRIAVALHSLGDGISPAARENLFNRPEDAEGFFESRGNANGEQGVDADDETRRRQREELMYWNAILESKREHERIEAQRAAAAAFEASSRPRSSTRGSSFDDFLKQDENAEQGTFVFNTGTDIRQNDNDNLIRRRGDGVRGLNQSILTNPFADEHGIDEHVVFENSLMEPENDEIMSDIYSTADLRNQELSRPQILSPPLPATEEPHLLDLDDPASQTGRSVTMEPEQLGPHEYITAGQDDGHEAYSSIQAWAQNSDPNFYSPLPVSPAAPLSEPELVSDGVLTPTDSASLAGSGEDIGEEARSVRSNEHGRYYDVLSDDEGMATPASWTEVGSVVSENEAEAVHA